MIQLKDVTKSYGADKGVVALKNITLNVGPAERVAVMGPSGSGKSTLLNLVCGLDEPTSGSVKVEGVELSGLSDDARTRLRREKIGMIFQTFNLLTTLTALENVALPLRLQGAIELGFAVVAAADHGLDLAAGVVDGQQRALRS